MAYEKYDIVDDFQAQIDVWISASDPTIILKSGEGAGLKSGSQKTILKLVQYTTADDPSTAISKFENILVTNRSGDTLTVTRGFWGSTPTGFDGDDYVYATNHTKITVDMQDEITRLENDKLDDGELRSAISGNLWKILFLNGAWVETALGLGSNGKYLRSNWVDADPSWGTPPLDVDGQTTISTIDRNNDYVAISDGSDSNNTKKVLISKIADNASESNAWLVERATNSEALAWTDTTRYTTPKQMRDNAIKTAIIQHSKSEDGFPITFTFPHWLWVIPKAISVSTRSSQNGYSSGWFWNWTNNKCSHIHWISGTESIYCKNISWEWMSWVISADATNVTIVYSYVSGTTIGTTNSTLLVFA